MDKYLYKLLLEKKEEDMSDAPEGTVMTSSEPKARKAADSVDDQIDSLILMYEKRAIRDDETNLMEALRSSSLKYLFEQEEDAPEEEPADAEAEPAEPSSPVGSEEVTAKPAEYSEDVPLAVGANPAGAGMGGS